MSEIWGESDSRRDRFLHETYYDALSQGSKRNECLVGDRIQHFPDTALMGGGWNPDQELSQILGDTSDVGTSLSFLTGSELHRAPINRRRPRPRKLRVPAISLVAIVVLLGERDRLVHLLRVQSTMRRRFAVHAAGNYMAVGDTVRSMGCD
jgi:hypothetical protein